MTAQFQREVRNRELEQIHLFKQPTEFDKRQLLEYHAWQSKRALPMTNRFTMLRTGEMRINWVTFLNSDSLDFS